VSAQRRAIRKIGRQHIYFIGFLSPKVGFGLRLSTGTNRHFPQVLAMASYKEMDAAGRNPALVKLIAKKLLLIADYPWTDWELDFLERMATTPPDRLTTRQAEVLFELRDQAETFPDIRGISVRSLIAKAYQGRVDLDEGDDAWIAEK
jgi:hypothetical protein